MTQEPYLRFMDYPIQQTEKGIIHGLYPLNIGRASVDSLSAATRLTLLCLQAVSLRPRESSTLMSKMAVKSLTAACPYIFGAMLGDEGRLFRTKFPSDLHQLFSVVPVAA